MATKPKFEVLTRDEVNELHEETLKVLKEKGVMFEDEEALNIFKNHGAKIDGKIVHFSRKMVEDAIDNSPSSFSWAAMDKNKSVKVGEGLHLQTSVGCPNVRELNGEVRSSTLKDLSNVIKINNSSDVVDCILMYLLNPNLKIENEHLIIGYEALKNTDKPLQAYNMLSGKVQTEELLNMYEIAYGKNKQEHFLLCGTTSSSPLKYSSANTQPCMEFAKRNQPIVFTPCTMLGVSAPISLLGGCIIQNAEALAGIVLVQLINPGNPVVYNPASTVANFKQISTDWGSPESFLMCLANYQLALNMYNLPVRSLSGLTNSNKVDFQAGVESLQGMILSVLAGAHLYYSGLGELSNTMVYSFEKQIIDEETFSRLKRIRRGIEFSNGTMSIDIINGINHGGTFITHDSTLENYRNRWMPSVSTLGADIESQEDILINANRLWKKRLEEAPDTLLDPELDKELKAFMEKCMK